jgi:hypothetical protein
MNPYQEALEYLEQEITKQKKQHERYLRQKMLFETFAAVENLQKQISTLPNGKQKHYVSPYILLGEYSRLNLGIQPKPPLESDGKYG